jgi:hypothetical protein
MRNSQFDTLPGFEPCHKKGGTASQVTPFFGEGAVVWPGYQQK